MLNWLRRVMMGRYGVDQLGFFLLAAAMVLAMISSRWGIWPLWFLEILLLALAYFRVFSRNISARAQENGAFLNFWRRVKGFFSGISTRLRDRSHRYYRCPQCRQQLRVPRGRGKIVITCPRCRYEFTKKT